MTEPTQELTNSDGIPIRVGQVWTFDKEQFPQGADHEVVAFHRGATIVCTEWDGLKYYEVKPSDLHYFHTLIHDPTTDAEQEPKCQLCNDSGMMAGWVPTYSDPANSGLAPEAEPCDCAAGRVKFPNCFKQPTPSRPKPIEPIRLQAYALDTVKRRLETKINELVERIEWLTDKATGGECDGIC